MINHRTGDYCSQSSRRDKQEQQWFTARTSSNDLSTFYYEVTKHLQLAVFCGSYLKGL